MERAYWILKDEVVRVISVHSKMALVVARDGAHMVDKSKLIFSSSSKIINS